MEKRKLVSMVDFVLEEAKETLTINTEQYDWFCAEQIKLESVRLYAKFLGQPLTLGMFVPVGENGEVLEEPAIFKQWMANKVDVSEHISESFDCVLYRAAKRKCLFEGFECNGEEVIEPTTGTVFFEKLFDKWRLCDDDFETIEDLVPYGLTLTENALR